MDSSTGKKRGMVLPFEPYSITFDEIEYSVNTPQVSHFSKLLLTFGFDNQGLKFQL